MNPEDPIEKLQRHYARLHEIAMPELILDKPRPVRWWEAVGGVAAGAAAVVIAVTVCLSRIDSAPAHGGILLQHQLRSAGLTLEAPKPEKRAQREGTWPI